METKKPATSVDQRGPSDFLIYKVLDEDVLDVTQLF
jgi:hypothetical protein